VSSKVGANKSFNRKGEIVMVAWDGDALAGSMEEAMERQQEAAEERRRARANPSSTEERERLARQESIRLSRARIEEQLRNVSNPVRRTMLERALSALETDMETSGPE
jgi:hypothetical protein